MSLFQDWDANRANPKGRLIMVLFRLASALKHGPGFLLPLTVVYGIFYRVFVEWFLCVELPWKTQIGSGLRLDHGQGLVVNDHTVIGKNCHLRHAITIGNKQRADGSYTGSPVIGDCVDVGAQVVILGELNVGDHAVIGAGSVVTKDVPAGAVMVGNPARVLRVRDVPARGPDLQAASNR